MARLRNRLTVKEVKSKRKPGRYADGAGLYLFVSKRGARAWVFRYTDRTTGKLRDKGLGPVADVSLKLARKKAHDCRLQLLDGIDPIDVKREQRSAASTERARRMTFWQCADRYIAAHRAGWRNEKHAAQWTATLTTYAKPINDLPVNVVDTGLVLKCIEPLWATKAETMTRVRQRIEAVLDWATVRKLRSGDNPARWRGHLDKMLPKRSKVQKVRHRPALPYADAADFMAELRKRDGFSARCLELQILTASRPGEAAGAQWDEFDLDGSTWIVPGERMKAGVDHRVPLSPAAVAMLEALPRIDGNAFPGIKGRSITTAAPLKLLQDMRPGLTAHGFRSTFRDWAGDCTTYPREVIEAALAHTIKDKAEAAYRRGDALARRAALMADWATYCATAPTRANVTPLNRKARA